MLKKMAWNAFKKTGSVDIFLEMKTIEGLERKIALDAMREETAKELVEKGLKGEENGTNQNQGNGNFRK